MIKIGKPAKNLFQTIIDALDKFSPQNAKETAIIKGIAKIQ